MTRGLLLFLPLILKLETAHEILRGIFLVPRIGERMSSLTGRPIATLIVLGVCVLPIGRTKITGAMAL